MPILAAFPEGLQRLAVTQVVRPQLQHGFAALLRPKLLRPLHPMVDLLHHRLDVAARDGKTLPPILVITHLVLMVAQVLQRLVHYASRARFRLILLGQAQLGLARLQGGDDRDHPALPHPADPPPIHRPARREASPGRRRREHVGQRVNEVQDGDERPEEATLQLPVVRRAVAHEGLPRRPLEPRRPRRLRQKRREGRPSLTRGDDLPMPHDRGPVRRLRLQRLRRRLRFHGVAHGVLPFPDVLVQLPHQLRDAYHVEERRRDLGTGIGGRRLARHGQQQPDLVFPPVAHPRGRGVLLLPVFRLGDRPRDRGCRGRGGLGRGRAAPGASRICKRPPSAITTANGGGVTPEGTANFSTSGKAANAATSASRSATRSAPMRRVIRSTCLAGIGRSASLSNRTLPSANERLAVPA